MRCVLVGLGDVCVCATKKHVAKLYTCLTSIAAVLASHADYNMFWPLYPTRHTPCLILAKHATIIMHVRREHKQKHLCFFFVCLQDIVDEATIKSLLSKRTVRFNIYPNGKVTSAARTCCRNLLQGLMAFSITWFFFFFSRCTFDTMVTLKAPVGKVFFFFKFHCLARYGNTETPQIRHVFFFLPQRNFDSCAFDLLHDVATPAVR